MASKRSFFMFISPNEELNQDELILSIEKPKKQPWWEKKGFIIAAVFSAIWLAFIWDYLFSSGWWGTRHELSPAEFIGGFCGLFLPVVLSFLLSSYFDRAAQLGFEAQTLRSYLNELVYPTDSGSVYTQALTAALREQVQEFKQVFTEVSSQTQGFKNQLQQWSEEMNRTVRQLDVKTATNIREISESVANLTKAALTANEKAAQTAADFNEQALSLQRVVQQSVESFTPLLQTFQSRIEDMQKVEQSFEKTNEETTQALAQTRLISDQMRSQVQAIETVIYSYESSAKEQGEILTANLAQAESVLKIQNEAMQKTQTVLDMHNEALLQAETAVRSHQGIVEKVITETEQQIQQLEEQFNTNVRTVSETAEETLTRLSKMNDSLQAASEKISSLPESVTAVQDKISEVQKTASLETAAISSDCIVLPLEARKHTVDLLKDATAILDKLQTYSVDMAHIFTPKAEDTLWKKYYEGDRAVFMRHITRMLSETQHKQIVDLYQANPDFNQAVSRYMAEFEDITKMASQGDENKLLMSILIGSDIGRLYMVLADVLKRNAA